MQRRDVLLALSISLAISALTETAQGQIKPYFLVIVDTSGSMTWCAGGSQASLGANDCSCHENNNCNNAFRTNRCGFPANRLGDAKCALQRIVDGVGGDAVFGLMQFERPCSGNCTNIDIATAGATCASNASYGDGQLVASFGSNVREWVDGSCQGSCTTFTRELTAGVWTPITRSLDRANEWLRGSANASFPYPTNPDGVGTTPDAPLAGDSQLACRPVSVILLTDGADTCAGNPDADPPNAAGRLNTGNVNGNTPGAKAFRTYVIGFGSGGDNFKPEVLREIARRGGTGNYLAASNEAELSAALNQIVADAQPPAEVCNDRDDDCDAKIDEGIPKFCDRPNNIQDSILCDEPNETRCDGVDDDCDGILDEGLTNVCGTCGEVPKEVCDSVDNDCDQRVDEGSSTLDACGNARGECQPGQLVCVEGSERCEGAVGPMDERCDCKDNDCDGSIDEDTGADPLCGEDMRCAGCRCVTFCEPVQEFGLTCAQGLAPDVQPNGECLCVEDNCDSTMCSREEQVSGGDVTCGRGKPDVGTCVCRAGSCVARCVGVTCEPGKVCSPSTGDCVEDNCRGLGCADGKRCDPSSGECVTDACAAAMCAGDEVCRAGSCEKSCSGVRCAVDELCETGRCVPNPCARVSCASGELCHPVSGECVTDRCERKTCEKGQVCSVSSGECESNPCWNVSCPDGQSCDRRGQCGKPGQSISPVSGGAAGSDGERPARAQRLIAAGGGGGCACSVPGPSGSSSRTPWYLPWLIGSVLGLGLRRRQQRRARLVPRRPHRPEEPTARPAVHVHAHVHVHAQRVAGILLLFAALLLGGCRVTPLCLNCGQDSGAVMAADSGMPDTGVSTPPPAEDSSVAGAAADSGKDAATPPLNDAGRPRCTPEGPEVCDGKDQDCDLRVDEEVVPAANNCQQRGVCAGTAPVCASGKFVCRYNSDYEEPEMRCDGLDNDCDGEIDETFTGLGDACEVGIGACRVKGTRRCNAAQTGLMCQVGAAKEPSPEVCNNEDDDCDGLIDEPKAEPGTNPSYVKDELVQLRSDLWMYKHEASRIDARFDAPGIITKRACSRGGVLPWTHVTWDEASAACEAAGLTLCELQDWIDACEGDSGSCGWAYTPSSGDCNGYGNGSACNGEGDLGALEATGERASCFADWGSAGRVFDLSGNAKEWTRGPQSPDLNPLRGGSYNNAATALRCDFDFSTAKPELRLPNVGFRCCASNRP